MSVSQVAERSTAYELETAMEPAFGASFDLLATAPKGVAKLRELILSLAVGGRLLAQISTEEPARQFMEVVRSERKRLIAAGVAKGEKQALPISEEEFPFELPRGWEFGRLGQLGALGSSSRVHQKDWTSSGVPFYRAREIVKLSKDGVVHNELFITEDLFRSLSQRGLSPECGDIMITGVGTIGVPYVVKLTDRFYFKDASVLIFKNHYSLNAHFLSLFMESPYWKQRIHADSMGTTVDTLTIVRAGAVVVPVPPLAEQARIVARVEELMQLCDGLEAHGRLQDEQHARLVATMFGALAASESAAALAGSWQRITTHFDLLLDRPEAVDTLEQTLLQLAVRGLLVPQDPTDEPASLLLDRIRAEKERLISIGESRRDKALAPVGNDEEMFDVPNGWQWVPFGDVVNISSGITLGRKTTPPKPVTLPYLRVANVQRWYLNLDHLKTITVDESELPRFLLKRGDLLLTEGGDWDKVGRTCVWQGDIEQCLHQNHVFKARGVLADWSPTWAELFLNSTDARTYFAGASKQTTNLASINSTQLKNCPFPIPPLAEQHRIVARGEQLRSLCAELRERLQQSRTTQSRLADALVAEAGT